MRSQSPISTRSCPGCWRTAPACSTPWGLTRISTSAWSAGSIVCAPRRATGATRRRSSARIAARAHQRAMRFCRPGATEYQVMAELLHEFRRHNADTAYHPIVGGGRNSCILHYRENNQPLAAGDLLLVDAGCELECYASDITRTFPVNGRFTPEQRAVYEVVLEA